MEICLYEGYIRNRVGLCAELGISCDGSRDDTERSIILHGHSRWKCDLVEHLYGSFAFVLRDEARGFFDRSLLRRYWEGCRRGDRADFSVIWTAYIFLVWYDTVFRDAG